MKSTINFGRLALIAFGILLIGLSASAQEAKIRQQDVPAAVISAFKSTYPNATVKGYSREKENGKVFYEIESKDGSTMRDLLYNADGTIAEIEETVAATDLPADAQETLRAKYPRAVVTRAEKVTKGNKVEYEVSARQGKRRIGLAFDETGKLLKGK